MYIERWPPFTSSVTFELFKKGYSGQGLRLQHLLSGLWNSHSKEEHCTFSTWVLQNPVPLTAMSNLDVWMQYRNKNLILPMCAKEGDHLAGSLEFCTLSVFQRRVKELTPTDWSVECAQETTSS